jgi:hypothetical protein
VRLTLPELALLNTQMLAAVLLIAAGGRFAPGRTVTDLAFWCGPAFTVDRPSITGEVRMFVGLCSVCEGSS